MITDKDREHVKPILKRILLAVEPFADEPALALFCEALEESADHARKEAAERVRKVMNVSEGGSDTIDKICAAILGDSAAVSPDSDKLAIAVKALIALYGWIKAEVENFGATCPDDFIIDMVEITLKEIQG